MLAGFKSGLKAVWWWGLALCPCGGMAQVVPPPQVQACAVCHGPQGVALAPDAPHLAGQPSVYLISQLKAYRGGMRKHEVMSLMAKGLNDADIETLARWYSAQRIRVDAMP